MNQVTQGTGTGVKLESWDKVRSKKWSNLIHFIDGYLYKTWYLDVFSMFMYLLLVLFFKKHGIQYFHVFSTSIVTGERMLLTKWFRAGAYPIHHGVQTVALWCLIPASLSVHLGIWEWSIDHNIEILNDLPTYQYDLPLATASIPEDRAKMHISLGKIDPKHDEVVQWKSNHPIVMDRRCP